LAVVSNQGLQGIAFFEATACLTLLVLFIHLRRDNTAPFYKLWLIGWFCLTISSFSQLAILLGFHSVLATMASGAGMAALVFFLSSILQLTAGPNRLFWPVIWLSVLLGFISFYYENKTPGWQQSHWQSAVLQSIICLVAARLLWGAASASRGHGGKLLAGAFTLLALNSMDRPWWDAGQIHLFRFAFDHFLNACLGIGMIVLLLETARSRTAELSEKMRQLTMLTASSSQSVSLQELLQKVLKQITASLGATHGMIRLLEGKDDSREFVVRASVGFTESYLKHNERFALGGEWAQSVLKESYTILRFDEEKNSPFRRNMAEAGITQLIVVPLFGQESPVGILNLGALPGKRYHEDELAYLVNVAKFLATTVENVNLFQQVKTVQQQWAYTFDSIGDPIVVHDLQGRVIRGNVRLANLIGKDIRSMVGRAISDLFSARNAAFETCPYCEGVAGEADIPDPWLAGYFLDSNSTFTDPAGKKLGTIHVLKDITERKRAEEKYRTLVASVQEGVFITTMQGRFLDFNDALMRIAGYENREELMAVDISQTLYANPVERDRLSRLLQEHGAVNDFEFDIRRKDGEVRTVSESSTAVRDAAGNVTAYQGFVLDVTERRRAEQEIRRRNRELVVLNSIAETLVSSLDLHDSVQRTLRQIVELFNIDTSALYLFEPDGVSLRRLAAVGHRSEFARHFPVIKFPQEFLQQIRAVRATFLSANGLPLPAAVRQMIKEEEISSAYVVPLWSKEKMVGGLTVGCRSTREFATADSSLLIAVASQVAGAVERSLLYEETRQAYENLRRTQEQLLHSEKLAAVGQLISGVAHELNNPLTAILGYSQLLTSSGQVGPLALGYTEKLYKQAQRTHRIVQNLLSFARQHRPERIPVQLNSILEDTLALRDYDLRMSQIRVHLDLAPDLPYTAADPHQLQQVFLNLINNAVDAILENGPEGDLWVRTAAQEQVLLIEFTDSGPGVKDSSRVFDPFYTTKPVGKGTGLGLSICYGIISEHGGTIRVLNSPACGATFRIELPLQKESTRPVTLAESKSESVNGARILVVDADSSVLDTVAGLLRAHSKSVETASSLNEARIAFQAANFDLLLVDLQLVIQEEPLFANGKLPPAGLGLGSRLLWMTSSAAADFLPVAPGATHDVLQKPFGEADLLAAVNARLLPAAAPVT
jgi:PAS domain S-box-containing protein